MLEYEADTRHGEFIVQCLGLTSANSVATPRQKKTWKELPMLLKSPLLRGAQITRYRSLIHRTVYLAQDRADLSECAKHLARRNKEPREIDWQDLKRLGRYLLGVPRVVQEFRPQPFPTTLTATLDGDHAGCVETCKSSSGCVVSYGGHVEARELYPEHHCLEQRRERVLQRSQKCSAISLAQSSVG